MFKETIKRIQIDNLELITTEGIEEDIRRSEKIRKDKDRFNCRKTR